MRLRLLLAMLFSGLLLTTAPLRAESVHIPIAGDLAQLGAQARERNLPILLMFSQSACPYCDMLAENFLKPMIISGDYEERVLIRMLKLDSYSKLRDFDGAERSVDEIKARYRISVTPTMVFLDDSGQQLAPRMVGITTPDFFGGYLDEAIDTAFTRLRHPQTVAQQRSNKPGS